MLHSNSSYIETTKVPELRSRVRESLIHCRVQNLGEYLEPFHGTHHFYLEYSFASRNESR